ncbi:Ig-like domain-containing protein [Aureivirga marina]|uniref:Ig-like domain-containing protein n=1 Tax=Aureivirga marina TaxID=1182451 RepID=UPI0018CB3492|nr:gliding motility-associated C-terminal domain-containing protein [Aureivirga marina]
MSPQKLFLKVFVLIFFISTYVTHSQTISVPQLMFDNACSSANHENFTVKVHTTPGFASSNVFRLQLSDAEGNFNNPTVVKEISGQNNMINHNITFQVPENTHGENYRVRLVSTQPQIIGGESDPFGAYKILDANLELKADGQVMMSTSLIRCGSVELSLHLTDGTALNTCSYNWYRNGQLIPNTSYSPSIYVEEEGEYYAEVDYGICSQDNSYVPRTLKLNISLSPIMQAEILGGPQVSLCEGNDLVLKAIDAKPYFTYKWFKGNEVVLEGQGKHTLTVAADDDPIGNYRYTVKNTFNCENESEEIAVSYGVLTVDLNVDETVVLLDNQTKIISANANSDNVIYRWFKDGELITGEVESTITISEQGTYKVAITSSDNCDATVESHDVLVLTPTNIEVGIDIEQDEEEQDPCSQSEVLIQLSNAKFVLSNGEKVSLTSDQIYELDIEWYRNNESIQNTGTVFALESYEDSGNYRINASFGDYEALSNSVPAVLLPELEIIASHDKLCEGSEVNLSTYQNESLTYKWYRDNSPIADSNSYMIQVGNAGTYYVEVELNGCVIGSESLEIETFNESSVTVSPSTNIVINRGEFQDIIVEGAEFYEWYDTDGNLLSSSSIYSVNEAGVFTVKAMSNECEVIKEITVEMNDNTKQEIPNVVTPNNDGYNDKWELPVEYTNSQTKVQILDTRGKTVFSAVNYQNTWPTQNDLSKANNSKNTPVFYYIIKTDNSIKAKGTITIIR